MPAHINRLIGALDTDERNSQYASAWRKAVTYLEASGNGLPKRYDDEGNLLPPTSAEQEEYRLRVKNTTLGVLRVRFALGFLAPASPQVQLKSDMAQWISDNGRANWKQAFNNLLDKYPGDYDAAMAKWVELFPDQVPYTVTESERKSIAPLRYAVNAILRHFSLKHLLCLDVRNLPLLYVLTHYYSPCRSGSTSFAFASSLNRLSARY